MLINFTTIPYKAGSVTFGLPHLPLISPPNLISLSLSPMLLLRRLPCLPRRLSPSAPTPTAPPCPCHAAQRANRGSDMARRGSHRCSRLLPHFRSPPYRASTAALPSCTVARGPVPAARLGCGMPTGQGHRGEGREWGSSAERRGHLSGMKQTWRAGTVSGRSRHGDRCGGWIFFILLISSTTGCAPMVMRYLIITVDPNPTGA